MYTAKEVKKRIELKKKMLIDEQLRVVENAVETMFVKQEDSGRFSLGIGGLLDETLAIIKEHGFATECLGTVNQDFTTRTNYRIYIPKEEEEHEGDTARSFM